MRIYSTEPPELIRLQIVRQQEETKYLTLCETTAKEVEELVKEIVVDQKLSPFQQCKRTSVNIREAVGAKNGKSKSVSFYGLSPQKLYDLIVEKLKSQ